MENNSILVPKALYKNADTQIIDCNDIISRFGLTLTAKDFQSLIETRSEALKRTGRIEFEGGTLNQIIFTFCDSPHLSQENCVQTFCELLDVFYYFKNELEWIADDELIGRMKVFFDTCCQGSVELLRDCVLERMVHDLRFGCYKKEELNPLYDPAGYFGEEEEDV